MSEYDEVEEHITDGSYIYCIDMIEKLMQGEDGVFIYKPFVQYFGCVEVALVLSELIRAEPYHKKNKKDRIFFDFSETEEFLLLAMKKFKYEIIINRLVKEKFIVVKMMGKPKGRYFHINHNVIADIEKNAFFDFKKTKRSINNG